METKIKLLRGCHSIGEANYHLQFTPKYRRHVFENPVIRKECERVLLMIAQKLKVIVAGIGFGEEHVHLFLSNCKNYSAAELTRRLKGASSRVLRANLWKELQTYYWGDSFWSDGYFYRSIGAVTYEVMKFYVEKSQEKHWKKQSYEEYAIEKQKTLSEFN
jgi:putative transposase